MASRAGLPSGVWSDRPACRAQRVLAHSPPAAPCGSRLTWSRQCPPPFESAFSLVGKLMRLNVARWAELWPYMGRGKTPTARCALRNSTRWDFERWCAHTGLPAGVLERAFLDRLDFRIRPRLRDGVRYCRACTRWGYHCTFFDLSILQRCPWHDEPLTRACTACLAQLSEPHAIAEAGHVCAGQNEALHGAVPHRVPESMCPVIERHCQVLLGWWLHLGERLAERDTVLGAFLEPGRAIEDLGTREQGRLEQAQRLANELAGRCPWRLVSAVERGRARPLAECLPSAASEVAEAHRLLFASPHGCAQDRWQQLPELVRRYERRRGALVGEDKPDTARIPSAAWN